MTSESDTPDSGTDNAQPLENDTPDAWDYFDPEEDNEEVATEEGTDDEDQAEESDTEAESEVEEEAVEEADDEQPAEKAPGLVTLADGSEVTHDELIKGYMRQSDYTRKQQETSNNRNKVAADAERIERITNAFVDQLATMVPPEPNPALAYSDPNKFTAQKAQYDAAIAQVQQIIQIADQPKEIKQGISQEDHANLKAEEDRLLVEALPMTATRDGRKAFWNDVVLDVASEVGFSEADMQGVVDHRLFKLADLAKKGLEAERAKTKVRAKVEKARPTAPRKPGQPAKQANGNAQAMRKLGRTGSIHDALAVDFE